MNHSATEHPEPVRARGEETIGWSTIAFYSAPLAPAYLLYMMLTVVFMNFATDVLLITPGVIGTIFFLSKIWDAISDPIVGALSDASTSRFGRRKSWMVGSVILLIITSAMLWAPPATLTGYALTAWVAASVFAFYTAFTAFAVPQMALGVELSPSPHQRSRIFAGRQVGHTLGMLSAFLVATPLVLDNPAARQNAATLALVGSTLLGTLILAAAWQLPKEAPRPNTRPSFAPLAAARDVAANPHARLILLVYFIEVFGIGATSAMMPFLIIYVIDAADYIGLVFLFYTAPALFSIPMWVRLGKRFERHKLWRLSMGLQAVGYGLILFQAEGRLLLMIVCCVLNGFASACGQTLGYSIKGDVIDWDELHTGKRKDGTYLAAWNLAAKLGTGLMIAISGWALDWSGFVPNEPQTNLVRWTIKGMTGGAPFVCLLVGMALFSRFSLDNEEAARVRAGLASRRT